MIDDESIAMFCSITGSDEGQARYFLEASGGEVEVAVGLFMDSNGKPPAAPQTMASPLEDEVRQPIAPKRGVLVEDEGYGMNTSHWVDPRQLQGRRPAGLGGPSPFASFADSVDLTTERGRRLAQLFKLPQEISFTGTFDGARKLAKSQTRYLLVSPHESSEFSCQMLNRDLWNQKDIQEFILDNLIFLQLMVGTEEAERYMRFYPFNGHPHIGLIDPRTGKAVKTWNQMPTPPELMGELIEYTERHPLKSKTETIVIEDSSADDDDLVQIEGEETDAQTEVIAEAIEAMPEEPPADAPNITTVQLRMPDGSRLRRRFSLDQPIFTIFAFVSATLRLPMSKFDVLEHIKSLKDLSTTSLLEGGLKNSSLNVMIVG